jgi:UDP-N-acetyl-D-mannosaminuronate dehydrogenase
MVESLLREAMDAAQIPRAREMVPAGVAPGERSPVIVLVDSTFELPEDEAKLSEADAIVISLADPSAVREACAAVCRRARRGQTIVLTWAGYVGATRDLLARPLSEAGFELGVDICLAFAAERRAGDGSRVVGACGPLCADKAAAALATIASRVQLVSSLEAAEMAAGSGS